MIELMLLDRVIWNFREKTKEQFVILHCKSLAPHFPLIFCIYE